MLVAIVSVLLLSTLIVFAPSGGTVGHGKIEPQPNNPGHPFHHGESSHVPTDYQFSINIGSTTKDHFVFAFGDINIGTPAYLRQGHPGTNDIGIKQTYNHAFVKFFVECIDEEGLDSYWR